MIEWLRQQPDPGSEAEMGDTSGITLLETIKTDHIELDPIHAGYFTKFTVSEVSGAIGITCLRDKPSLSIIYSDTDKAPLILSRDDRHASAHFIQILGKEYLAATFKDVIHLWNPADNTLGAVYKFREEKKLWLLGLIDERTVAAVSQYSSDNKFFNIHILKTDVEMWNLSSSHLVKTTHPLSDMSYVKTTDGTASLLLSCPGARLVQSVELVGGKVQWQVDKQQIDESFYPWSICTDGSTVFVAGLPLNQLHLFSVDDGSVLTYINLRSFAVNFPRCVRLQGEHLYVGHLNEKGDTYCISKFTKPTEV